MLTTEDYLKIIGDLWLGEEYTDLEFHYSPLFSTYPYEPRITVTLTLSQEYGNPHQADWAEYRWSFHDTTAHAAFQEAAEWLWDLVKFKVDEDV